MDVVDLARLQFAVTGNLHFLFVVLTLGLAPLVAIMHTRLAISGNLLYERMTRFWGQIYVINYALGIFTGLVMEFQFGLNWSGLTSYAGDVFGTPLALETLLAFFLESTFLGLWIFGWHRLPRGLHVACIWLVTLTAYASALFIMVANSFLQNPVGSAEEGGRLVLRDFGALFTNPTLVFALPHVLSAGLWAGGFVVMGASAYHLYRRTAEREFFTRSLRIGVLTAFIGSLFTVGFGYAQFGPVSDVQPDKFHGAVPGLALGLMITIGQFVQFGVMFVLAPLLIRDLLARWRWLHPLLMLMTPLPFVAAIAGWLTREVGRQPWLVYGKLSVADALTPGLTPAAITASFAAFAGVLGLLAVVDWALIIRAVRRGPGEVALGAPDHSADHSPAPAHSF
ncbi:cytochrome ubiquinol oxidase subunit I [Microbispora triticiradicis]|uniref:Cytochrome ubiquinol oxidase subunit I n=3 Tax=Microbispora TaxID=2005 RepID=A0ABY3LRP4_9ACTN|nr:MULTISPECIES: cytochrome ubiquinol oxidase subunit I [Microbispora]RGA03749.1 cytochrome ubiquinol oxidase subunit I [Microbispora triticiradicis]TLP59631.1 cytochrome ubiquinol oxidase subunit I [Microbispora fusca]TYB51392.1 cytochrome ubiquinol oxidase subunit I [Microbispora tritici]